MPLQTKLSLIEVDPTGTLIKIRESTGLYNSSNNENGYGGPNILPSDIKRIMVTASRFKSEAISSVIYSRDYDPDYPVFISDPSIDQIAQGEPIILSSLSLRMNEEEEGLLPFRDSVWDINSYSFVDPIEDIYGEEGDTFISGQGLDSVMEIYDAIEINGVVYDIDKSKPNLGGTVLNIIGELEDDVTSFQPAYRANIKVLVDAGSYHGLRILAASSARNRCSSEGDREDAYEAIVHISSATDAMACGSYEEADWNINESYRLTKQ